MTLRFLGAAGPERLEGLREALGETLRKMERFVATMGNVGTFGSRRVPHVLWLGFREGEDELADLLRRVSRAAEASGFQRERRAGKPHLTLARNPRRRPLDGWPDGTFDAFGGLELPVAGVTLYSSELRPKGAVYAEVWTVPLAERQ